MKLTGVEIPFNNVFQLQPGATLQPNTVMIVVSDENGDVKLVKVNHDSITEKRSLLGIASGCFVRVGGQLIWVDPCPY